MEQAVHPFKQQVIRRRPGSRRQAVAQNPDYGRGFHDAVTGVEPAEWSRDYLRGHNAGTAYLAEMEV